MKPTFYSLILMFSVHFGGCDQRPDTYIEHLSNDSPSIEGKQEYLNSPYLTAGNRVYMVGQQNGSFAELGWHIEGEMDGIWDHPIKLMDGFIAKIQTDSTELALTEAERFINYPYMNRHDFTLKDTGLKISRWQYVPDDLEGIGIQFIVENSGDRFVDFSFIFEAYSDLRPTWLGERTNMKDGPDLAEFNENTGQWIFRDSLNHWYTLVGAGISPTQAEHLDSPFRGSGVGGSLHYELGLESGETRILTFVISGSYHSQDQAKSTFSEIQNNFYSYLENKKIRYQQLAEKTRLKTPDEELNETFEWLKYNADWLIRTVPEIGTGIGAGIPDYPWWFGVDSEYALQGYMAVGQQDIVYQTIALLDSVSEALNGNGRIIHEMSTNGAVFNPGNINETPQFTSLIWEVYRWNGDIAFLKEYFPTIRNGLEWLMQENDDNKNLFPDGFGMMEIHGLDSEMIDVASYTQRAFRDASFIASELGMYELAEDYMSTAEELRERINEEFWSDQFNSYADFIGTDEQAVRLIGDAIIRADTLNKPWAVEELKTTRQQILSNPSDRERPFVVHHNWVVNTPMEMGIADSSKAVTALETAKQFTNPFGVFVTGIDRDESAGSDEGSFVGSKVFSYTGAVMTLPTGVQAIAENNYGRPDEALDYLNRMTRSFSYALPGSMYEVSPDYGMMTQAWNIYSYAIPIVRQFFGVQPMASEQQIYLKPQMPSDWDTASLEHVYVGDKVFSFYYSKDGDEHHMTVEQNEPHWSISFVEKRDTTAGIKSGISTFSW